jgi:hypothetical protein
LTDGLAEVDGIAEIRLSTCELDIIHVTQRDPDDVRPEFNENVFNGFTRDLAIQQMGGVARASQSRVEVGQPEWKDRVRLVAAVAAD